MEMSRLKEGVGRIKEERVVYDDDGCLKLFGEKVLSRRDGDGSDDGMCKPIDDHKNKVGNCGENSKVAEMSSYSRGVKQFMMMNQQRRQVSVLERQILPGIVSKSNAGGDIDNIRASSQQQLTIFYAGMVNVFDDIPPEKAEAMVLLARQSCISNNKEPVVVHTRPPNSEAVKKPPPPPAPSGCRLQHGLGAEQKLLPVARKISLQHFMEKRRLRITTRSSPYNYPPPSDPKLKQIIMEEEEEEEKSKNVNASDDDDDDDHINVSLSPFPSRSRYFCH